MSQCGCFNNARKMIYSRPGRGKIVTCRIWVRQLLVGPPLPLAGFDALCDWEYRRRVCEKRPFSKVPVTGGRHDTRWILTQKLFPNLPACCLNVGELPLKRFPEFGIVSESHF